MRNLRLRQATIASALACSLAALLAMPALLAAVASAQSAGDEYDLELPSAPSQGQGDGGPEAESAGADPVTGPSTDPAPGPSGDVAEPTGASSGGGSGSGDAEDDADSTSPQPPGFEPQLATGGTPGNPGAEDDFPIVPVALVAAAVLAVPFGIWLLRRGRA
jgi:hypothetical protein